MCERDNVIVVIVYSNHGVPNNYNYRLVGHNGYYNYIDQLPAINLNL